MIDTHAHLTSPTFADDLPAVLSRARAAGVLSIICVSESLPDARAALALHAEHGALVRPALGLHPEVATTIDTAELPAHLAELSGLLRAHAGAVAAVGEVGLDFTPRVLAAAPDADVGKARQRAALSGALRLATEAGLPLSVHSRSAGRHALALLSELHPERRDDNPPAVMHAFDGRPIHAERALAGRPYSLYFSVPPCVARSEQLVRLVKRVPLERLLLESDAPALPTVAGERNEPAEIVRALQIIAAVKGSNVDFVRHVMMQNSLNVFPTLRQDVEMG